MVSKPGPRYRLPSTPQPAGRLIESSVMLWLASWRQAFWYSLLYGVAGLLPVLTLGDLTARVLRSSLALLLDAFASWLPLGSSDAPLDLLGAAWAWFLAPQTWLLFGAAALLALASITALIYRQQRIAQGDDPGLASCTLSSLRRAPVAIGAWLVYAMLLLTLTLPLMLLTAAVFWLGRDLGLDLNALLVLCALYLLGALLLSIPLVWASVAAGFAPFASTIEGCGPLAAQRLSLRRVRGHWTHAAVVVSVPMLMYLGIGSTVSSLALTACGLISFALGGWPALISGAWLGWSQMASAIPMAMALPLAFAGGVVAWHDLGLRLHSSP